MNNENVAVFFPPFFVSSPLPPSFPPYLLLSFLLSFSLMEKRKMNAKLFDILEITERLKSSPLSTLPADQDGDCGLVRSRAVAGFYGLTQRCHHLASQRTGLVACLAFRISLHTDESFFFLFLRNELRGLPSQIVQPTNC